MKNFIYKILQRGKRSNKQSLPEVIELNTLNNKNGIALVSYVNNYLSYNDTDPIFNGHSSKWRSKNIVDIFLEMGYDVDAINYNNNNFIPSKKYNIIFDIHQNLARLGPLFPRTTINILHSTGSYPLYAANRELARVSNLMERKKKYYAPKRICETVYFKHSLEIANVCSLHGNAHTKNTFPVEYRDKITLIPVTYSLSVQKELNQPLGDEYLWFYGSGSVHKGLDILLDLFSQNQNYKLNIVGNVDYETDFMQIYKDELNNLPNIKYHGFIDPLSDQFKQIIQRCFAFIAPSCSESTSTAAVTCLNIGLYPIYSIDNGLTLPEDTGYLLENCSHDEILKAVKRVSGYSEKKIKDEIKAIRSFITKRHSRENFTEQMRNFLETAILSKN